jgi:GT2 family glycosyltransferase
MFDKYGGFRTDLGPSPNRDTPAHSEDTEFVSRLIAAGEQLWYEPSAVVHHPVAESRIDKKYFLAWWRHKGRADVRQFESQPVHLLCSLIAWTLRWLVAADPCVRFYRKQVVWMKAGAIAECYRLRARMRS